VCVDINNVLIDDNRQRLPERRLKFLTCKCDRNLQRKQHCSNSGGGGLTEVVVEVTLPSLAMDSNWIGEWVDS